MTRIDVGAGEQLLMGFLRTPPVGICELVWNAFDADAKNVSITIETDSLDAIDRIKVSDDGVGMDSMVVKREFSNVGDSFKATSVGAKSTGGRVVHGRHGRGRFSAFSLGSTVTWESTSEQGEELKSVVVRGSREDLRGFDFEEPARALSRATGTNVIVSRVSDAAQKSFDRPDSILTRLTTEFALHLERYSDFGIQFLGSKVESADVIESKVTVDLDLPDDIAGSAQLVVIEWKLKSVDRRLYMCDSDGTVLNETYARIQAPGIQMTAYVLWDGFRDDPLALEMDAPDDDREAPASARVVNVARQKLREHVATISRQKERATVERWKAEGIYPYATDDPVVESSAKAAARDAFEYVALAASRSVDEGKSRQTKKLALALLKEAFETDPDRLFPLLREVTNLPSARIDELQGLLDRTSLSNVIQTGHKVGSRIDFLNGLDEILHERSSRSRLRERTQLHRILVNETWVFGEEWSVCGDDERLSKVLKKFIPLIQDDDAPPVEVADDNEPLREDGRIAIPDLVLGRKMQLSENRFKFLVVELKRPNHDLTDADVSQIRSYADAICNDERLGTPDVDWTFVLVGNDIKRTVDDARKQPGSPFGVIQMAPYRIEVRRWSELIADGHHRMKFVQDSLDYRSSHSLGIQALRESYASYLPDVDDAPVDIESSADGGSDDGQVD